MSRVASQADEECASGIIIRGGERSSIADCLNVDCPFGIGGCTSADARNLRQGPSRWVQDQGVDHARCIVEFLCSIYNGCIGRMVSDPRRTSSAGRLCQVTQRIARRSRGKEKRRNVGRVTSDQDQEG